MHTSHSAVMTGREENSIPTPPAKGNTSYVLEDVKKTVFEDRPLKPLASGEVRGNVRQTGLCGSDVHYKEQGRIGEFVLRSPMVLGHESAGVVTDVAPDVTDLRPGDRVTLEPGVPCRSCPRCLAGDYNHCQALVFAATPPHDGTLATYYNIHHLFAHKLPDNMTMEEGSLMEPLAVSVHATVGRGHVRALDNVLVLGAGPIGLLCGAVARAYGAKRVVCVDIKEEKLKTALDFCATSTYKSDPLREGESGMDCSARNARQLIDQIGDDVKARDGFDVAIEATGAQACVQLACWAVRPRGRLVWIGMGHPDAMVPVLRTLVREVEMTGSFRYAAGDYERSIGLVSSGKIDVSKIVTHRYVFDDADKAFAATANAKGEDGRTCIKVQVCQGAAERP